MGRKRQAFPVVMAALALLMTVPVRTAAGNPSSPRTAEIDSLIFQWEAVDSRPNTIQFANDILELDNGDVWLAGSAGAYDSSEGVIRRYTGEGSVLDPIQVGNDSLVTSFGRLFAAGEEGVYAFAARWHGVDNAGGTVIRYDPAGNALWSAEIPPEAGYDVAVPGIVSDGDGGLLLLVVRTLQDPLSLPECSVRHLTPDGELETLSSINNFAAVVTMLAAPNGGFYLLAKVYLGDERGLRLARYSGDGSRQWQVERPLTPPGMTSNSLLCLDREGQPVFVTTESEDSLHITRYSPFGEVTGEGTWAPDGSDGFSARDMVADPGGRLVIAGRYRSVQGGEECLYFYTLALDSDLQPLWWRFADGAPSGSASHVIVLGDGTLLVQGTDDIAGQDPRVRVEAYDEQGNLLYAARHATEGGTMPSINRFRSGQNGSVYAAGDAEGAAGSSVPRAMHLLKFQAFSHASAADNSSTQLPARHRLVGNYPNPFNAATGIRFNLSRDEHVRLAVYDLLGRQVAVLVNQTLRAGAHRVTWDARGRASGVYFVRMEAGGTADVLRMSLVK